MPQTFTALRAQILTKRKSSKVADEAMLGMPAYADGADRGRHSRNGFFVLYAIVRIPFSILSCFCKRRGNAADSTWVTGDLMRSSEIDHLMVSDSMRYAILM